MSSNHLVSLRRVAQNPHVYNMKSYPMMYLKFDYGPIRDDTIDPTTK